MIDFRSPDDIAIRPHGNRKWAIWGKGTRKPLRVVKIWSEAGVIARNIANRRNVNVQMFGIDQLNDDGSSNSRITKRDEVIERILARY